MKRFKLLKDAPCTKAGTVFEENVDRFNQKILVNKEFQYMVIVDKVNNFDEWFEEVSEYKRPRVKYEEEYYYIDDWGDINTSYETGDNIDDYRYSIGDYGITSGELEAKREYNIARQVLLDDAEGGKFTPGSSNFVGNYSYGTWDSAFVSCYYPGDIYFRTKEALKKSLEEHKEQWEIVRQYEMVEL